MKMKLKEIMQRENALMKTVDNQAVQTAQEAAPRIVVLTGAGISAESGISTFRDANGLWENHRIEEVASPRAFATNPDLVHRFYDARRAQLDEVTPNAAHWALARLESVFPGEVLIITQNVDDLHEAASSENVVHMHGRLRSSLCTTCGHQTKQNGELGDRPACTKCGEHTLRPDIVWFGEQIREEERILHAVKNCEIFAVIGTSGVVHPAAGFVKIAAGHGAQTVLIDLDPDAHESIYDIELGGLASELVPHWVRGLMLRHGGGNLRENKGEDLSWELVRTVDEFIQSERTGRVFDLGEGHVPQGLPELLDKFGLLPDDYESHHAMFELAPLIEKLLSDDGNLGEGGPRALAVHMMSHADMVEPMKIELEDAQLEYAADLIAWMLADLGPVNDDSPGPGDLNWRVAKYFGFLSVDFTTAGETEIGISLGLQGDLSKECTKDSLPDDLEGVLSIGMHLGLPLAFQAEKERLLVDFVRYETKLPNTEESASSVDSLLDIHARFTSAQVQRDDVALGEARAEFEKAFAAFSPSLEMLTLMNLLEATSFVRIDEAAAEVESRMYARRHQSQKPE